MSSEWLERLSESTKTPTSQLRFIMDAWAQVGSSPSAEVEELNRPPSRVLYTVVGSYLNGSFLAPLCVHVSFNLLPQCTSLHAPLVKTMITQIIECRRVLSWTYTYGYYAYDIFGTESGSSSAAAAGTSGTAAGSGKEAAAAGAGAGAGRRGGEGSSGRGAKAGTAASSGAAAAAGGSGGAGPSTSKLEDNKLFFEFLQVGG